MDKIKMLRPVNALLLLAAIVQVFTIVIIFFRIKIPNSSLVFEIHEYNGLLMVLLIAVHITLNWGWIKANFLKRR